MSYCVKCGAKVDDGIMTCPQCGAQIPNLSGSYSRGSQNSDTGFGQSGAQGYTYGQQGYGQDNQYGYQAGGYQQDSQYGYQSGGYQQYGYEAQRYGSADFFDQSEVSRNKAMGVLSYLGILLLIPLLAGDKQSQYVKHHVNQGLVLFLASSLVDLLEGDWV